MGIFAPATIIGRPISTGYQIARSLRFRASASPDLHRTFGTPTNRNIWTLSFWFKRGKPGTSSNLFMSSTAAYGCYVGPDDTLRFYTNTVATITTTALFRDPSAWMHLVCKFDQVGAGNVTYYINNTQVGQATVAANSNIINTSGVDIYFGPTMTAELYLADAHFVDGQALNPSSFAQTDPTTGAWNPISYVGTYGANGFKLNFSDNSAATAAAIGADRSGNGNNWTPVGISVTAGITNDSLVDVPTNYGIDTGLGGEVGGNYATLSPLHKPNTNNIVLSQANLHVAIGTPSGGTAPATIAMGANDKVCFQFRNNTATNGPVVGIVRADGAALASFPGTLANSVGFAGFSGNKYVNGAAAAGYGAAWNAVGNIVTAIFSGPAGAVWFAVNGVLQNSATLAEIIAGTTTHAAATGLTGDWLFAIGNLDTASAVDGDVNFGQRAWDSPASCIPTGFKALCTQNFIDPVIAKPNQYFDAKLYAGTGAAQSITGMGLQPDLLWIKNRGVAASHHLVDSSRGVANAMFSDATSGDNSRPLSVTAFNSDGFSLGTGSDGNVNTSASNYVPWCWKKGATPGFDIVPFAMGASGAQTVPHGLGITPSMVIMKRRVTAGNWLVWLTGYGTGDLLNLNTTAARATVAGLWGAGMTASVLGINPTLSGGPSENWIAYAFAEVPGFSKFGSYTGNASADGPFVWCGFRPRFILTRRTDAVADWIVVDAVRNVGNVSNTALFPDLNAVENTSNDKDFLSNGFKLRNTAADNVSGGTYIFAAFAETPFKTARAR